MRKFFIHYILFLVVILGGIFSSLIWWSNSTKPVSNDEKSIRFTIAKGKTGTQIATELYNKGLIKSPLAFKIYIRLKGKTNTIQAGEFSLSPNLSMFRIIEKLGNEPLQLWVTIPEGLRREEIVERFIVGLEIPEIDLNTFRKDFLESSKSLEGKLFPDTYLFPRDVRGSIVVTRMHDLFNKKIAGFSKNPLSANLTNDQIITLASMIERETKSNDEKPVVAGIILNRLNIGMALQIDAAVQYAVANSQLTSHNSQLKNWWPILNRDNLNIDSRFNTYKYNGLPPSPIASPGTASLEAAFSPGTTEYIFYIHGPDGKIHYARTLTEHNENVRKYLGK